MTLDALTAEGGMLAAPRHVPDPSAVKLPLHTSGTTGRPVTHITGYLNALELPFATGIPSR